MRVLKNPGWDVRRLEFSPDGSRLLGMGHACRVWEWPSGKSRLLPTGARLFGFMPDGEVFGFVKESPSGGEVFGFGEESPAVLSLEDDEIRWRGEKAMANLGDLFVSASAGRLGAFVYRDMQYQLHFWSLPEFRHLSTRKLICPLLRAAFTPDGRHLAALETGSLTLQELDGGTPVWKARSPGGGSPHRGPVFSGDSKWLALSCGPNLWVYAADTGAVHARIALVSRHCQDIAFTPDSRFLALVSYEATVKVYETGSWTLQQELAWEIGELKSIAFSRDGMLGAAGGSRKVVVWDIDW